MHARVVSTGVYFHVPQVLQARNNSLTTLKYQNTQNEAENIRQPFGVLVHKKSPNRGRH